MGHLILFKKKYLFSIVEWYVNKRVASFLISISWFPNKKQQVEVSQGVILTTGIYLYSVLNLPYLECLSLKKKDNCFQCQILYPRNIFVEDDGALTIFSNWPYAAEISRLQHSHLDVSNSVWTRLWMALPRPTHHLPTKVKHKTMYS